ncbi:MAG: Penicillin amidase family protein [uncultured Sphingomonas sp.]|uniref:Penicillin amidase family protein n=1 Tax=uncultured Sphingomonas sp. TaxID=158754 RepID=A0A6J4SYJ9_9SPHN|nr:MAG: Penicillin amidase family protein [uncultured Sphingomonas sp.]
MHKLRAAALPFLLLLTAASPVELARWRATADRVTITRDDWGIAHVHGKTDADAVFGMIYAQAEDDFRRIEDNYLTALGRTAEAEGEKAIWQDLRARLYVSEAELKAYYARSPARMQRLMNAWADGLNYFLARHPDVRPRVLKRFEPWMVLSFTEGSIGGDIEKIDLGELERFYSGKRTQASAVRDREPRGSNGIAIAPALTRDGKALLLINPHTSFFFRSEQQVSSGEGLNVYGAATWGQFFIYQGFNGSAGWMHTSSGVDNVDEFAVDTVQPELGPRYRYGNSWREFTKRQVTIRYRNKDGRLVARRFNTFATHHGPVVKSEQGRWVAFAMMNRPVEALQQSFGRTKTRDLASFLNVAQLRGNSSNNTIFASSKGEIAYLHPQFVPRRNDRFDYSKPVDGSDPATDWGSLHAVQELPNAINPPNGWVQNTNAWPYRAAGEFSPTPVRYPKYMDLFGENFRGLRAQQLLTGSRGWTLDRLQAAAFDNYQTGFAALIPTLLQAHDALQKNDPRRAQLAAPISALRGWDFRAGLQSVPQSLAMFWGEELRRLRAAPATEPGNIAMMQLARRTSAAQKLDAFSTAVAQLQRDFGRWQVPWGEVNRLQRLPSTSAARFSDDAASTPIPFASSVWGSLPAFGSKPMPGTRRWYGERGNSFVAVVEFGPRVRARGVSAGGASGEPASPHFNDQSQRYASGALRDVYFYPEQLKAHTERRYRPGD